jgi:hypothetical protein
MDVVVIESGYYRRTAEIYLITSFGFQGSTRVREASDRSNSLSVDRNGLGLSKRRIEGEYPSVEQNHCIPLSYHDNRDHFIVPSPWMTLSMSSAIVLT